MKNAVLTSSRPLAEAHRLDLALFVAFEEASLRIGDSLVRHAPDQQCRDLALQQVTDDAMHHERFHRRLEQALTEQAGRAAATEAALLRLLQGTKSANGDGLRAEEVVRAVVIPPLRSFLDHCCAVADAGCFLDAVALFDLTLKGMAYPLYHFEVRYWQPVDPELADAIQATAIDERRHIAAAAELLRRQADDPALRQHLSRLCSEGAKELDSVFRYYVRKLVQLFVAASKQHPELFAGTELSPGRPIVGTTEEEQMAILHAAQAAEHTRFLQEARLDSCGLQEPIPHA